MGRPRNFRREGGLEKPLLVLEARLCRRQPDGTRERPLCGDQFTALVDRFWPSSRLTRPWRGEDECRTGDGWLSLKLSFPTAGDRMRDREIDRNDTVNISRDSDVTIGHCAR
jgi:hypothetical protein